MRHLAEVDPDFCTDLCFPGPDRVIAAIGSLGRLRLWDFGGAGGWQAPQTVTADTHGIMSPVVVAARAEVCVLTSGCSGTAIYLDAKTLSSVGGPLSGQSGTWLLSSPGNTWHALGGNRFVDVVTSEFMTLREIGVRPQTDWRPADLITIQKAASLRQGNPDALPWYDLLLACLEHRFGSDVRLGHHVRDIGEDEISIG